MRKKWLPLTVLSTVPRAGGFGLVWIKAAFPEGGKKVFSSEALLSVKGRRKETNNQFLGISQGKRCLNPLG